MSTIEDMKSSLERIYTPTTPIRKDNLFFGRKTQLDKIHEAVMQKGQHLVLYGERGVGKTSLANIVTNQYRLATTPTVTCNINSTLNGIWKSIFKQLPFNIERRKKVGFVVNENQEAEVEKITKISDLLDSQANSGVDDITNLLTIISDCDLPVLFVFDEFDQVKKRELIQGMSNIIKFCSDKVSNVTIMLVGIGNSVNDLIEEHQSIERCVKQIYIERMSNDELKEILVNANLNIGVVMPEEIMQKIVLYSSGFPHYTHLLGKFTTLSALNRQTAVIESRDFSSAIEKAMDNVYESIRNAYQKAIITTKAKSYFPQVLAACALAPTDEHGTFRISDLEDVLETQLHLPMKMQAYQYHIGKLCSKKRGEILEKIAISETQSRYRFSNPLFKGFLRLKHHRDSLSKSE